MSNTMTLMRMVGVRWPLRRGYVKTHKNGASLFWRSWPLMNDAQFTTHPIFDEEHVVHCGVAPESWCPDEVAFEQWWDLHPEALGKIVIHGKTIDTPRWQQAYGRDYQFSGQTNVARALTPQMVSVLQWCQTNQCHGMCGRTRRRRSWCIYFA